MSPSPEQGFLKNTFLAARNLAYILSHDLKNSLRPANKIRNISFPEKSRMHFVYFSCAAHFEYLLESQRTLAGTGFGQFGNIYLYIDKRDFLLEKQAALIRSVWPAGRGPVIRKTKHPMSWGGAGVIVNELEAFDEIESDMGPDDYLAKVDSDVLFSSDTIFKKVMESGAEVVGQKTTNEYAARNSGGEWMQGGLFFLRRQAAAALSRRPVFFQFFDTLKRTSRGITDCPEDAFLFFLCSRLGLNIEMMRYMLDIIVSDSMPSSVILEKVDYNWGLFSAWHCRSKRHWLPVLERLRQKKPDCQGG